MVVLSTTAINAAVAVAGLLIYVFIWFASRDLPRFAKMLARLAPLSLVVPVLLLLSGSPIRREASAPPVAAPKEQVGKGEEQLARRSEEQTAPPSPERSAKAPPVATPQSEGPAPTDATRAPQPPGPTAARAPATEPPATPPDSAPASGTDVRSVTPPAGGAAAPQTDWDVVPVFYGTDRGRKDEPKRIAYSSERAHRLELGRALITVPKSHQQPNIERPFAIRIPYFQVTLYQGAEDPKQHFTVQEIKALTHEQFLALVRERVTGSQAFKDQAVLFVHGYNTDFDYALYRTAQMAYDLQFDGASFLYSWPSGGDFMSYGYDRDSSSQAELYLREFIELVVRESGAKSVSVIAHSMGNMPLLRVLQALGPSLPADVRLNQIILAAPDVDRDLFANLAANIRALGRGVTLYCSANDRAMAAARRVAGGIPRAGDVPSDGPILVEGVDTIDVTSTSTDYLALNHSGYAEKGALLNDIALLLQTGERPPERRIPILQRITTPRGDFWRYPVVTR